MQNYRRQHLCKIKMWKWWPHPILPNPWSIPLGSTILSSFKIKNKNFKRVCQIIKYKEFVQIFNFRWLPDAYNFTYARWNWSCCNSVFLTLQQLSTSALKSLWKHGLKRYLTSCSACTAPSRYTFLTSLEPLSCPQLAGPKSTRRAGPSPAHPPRTSSPLM